MRQGGGRAFLFKEDGTFTEPGPAGSEPTPFPPWASINKRDPIDLLGLEPLCRDTALGRVVFNHGVSLEELR